MRRSPRFLRPLLWLGYDEFEHLVSFLSVDEALLLAQTCRFIFTFALPALHTTRLQSTKDLQHKVKAMAASDFLQLPCCTGLKYKLELFEYSILAVMRCLEWNVNTSWEVNNIKGVRKLYYAEKDATIKTLQTMEVVNTVKRKWTTSVYFPIDMTVASFFRQIGELYFLVTD